MILEVVVYTIDAAIKAQDGGADRIELCDNPGEGGTTPSAGVIQQVKTLLNIPVFVMIRPRGGDFCYSDHEFESMKHDISFCKSLNIPGVVFGILTSDGEIDKVRCAELIKLARPMQVTCHRAFDMTKDPRQSLEDCIALGFNRILTSGHQLKAEMGIARITQLVEQSEGRINIMPGSGINEQNVIKIISTTKVKEVHFGAMIHVPSDMQYQNSNITGMGSTGGSEFLLRTVDPNIVSSMRQLAERADS
ncbi:copper homeostasis protein CutC [Chryseotalea sanaruensis]|uniref:PF03932 family protein CutC n=1 Tax=Chryseotalea sanaruensis TaxID=2482724 RepID=A0A401UC35_9BACT|nr:copper homeostasis protein CutC [Chryseotalea sanaruensis]GCC52440.1 copper homeostasis protein CutC [Chryseotalea sanaruensis]